ncbi:MAG: beta-Ala-His dipeptidase, partial [Lachnospiraceae bacterium]
EADSAHDFLKDGIRLRTDGEWLFAEKTTLGGDDGIAVAYCLALLSDETLKHPALEMILTTDEETGMDGAKALDASVLSGKYMINLDSEEENVVLCGCAGGARMAGKLPLKRFSATGKTVNVKVCGLMGGHSGVEIDKNRTNAVLLLARYLFLLREQTPFLLADFSGGQKDNAIPRDAAAVLLFPEGISEAERKAAEELTEELAAELRAAEPDVRLCLDWREDAGEELSVLHPLSFEKFLFLLMQAPNGVQVRSTEIPGLVESSLNLGVCRMEEQEAAVYWSLRSSRKSYLSFLKEKLAYLIDFLGGEWEVSGEYPAWEYKTESGLREVYSDAYLELFGKRPEFATVHAGLECGILGEKLPGLDMISIGPEMKEIHTPAERLNIASALRIYRLLEKILADGGVS